MENPYSLARDILLSALSADRFTSIDLYGASVHESEFLTAYYHGITVTIDFSAITPEFVREHAELFVAGEPEFIKNLDRLPKKQRG